MAFIYKSAETPSSPLSLVDHERCKDMYRLAKMGNAQCRRIWNDWAAEQPAMARIVVADCDSDQRASVKAKKSVDKVLVKAEKKPKKVKAATASLSKSEKKAMIRSSVPAIGSPEHFALAMDRTLRGFADSPDPAEREAAKKLLRRV